MITHHAVTPLQFKKQQMLNTMIVTQGHGISGLSGKCIIAIA